MEKGNKINIVMKIFIFVTLAVVSMLLILNSNLLEANKEIRRFEETFGLNLPKAASVIFSEDTHGARGDGVRLYIYQINSKDMAEFIKQKELNIWLYLPINETLYAGVLRRINGLSSGKIEYAIRSGLDCKLGYYFIRNRHYIPLKGYDFSDISYYNIIIGIIDLDKNKIYYYTYDM